MSDQINNAVYAIESRCHELNKKREYIENYKAETIKMVEEAKMLPEEMVTTRKNSEQTIINRRKTANKMLDNLDGAWASTYEIADKLGIVVIKSDKGAPIVKEKAVVELIDVVGTTDEVTL